MRPVALTVPVCDHYAVLAEYDGTGVPLAYISIRKEGRSPGVQRGLLKSSLDILKEKGLIFGCDEDSSEILRNTTPGQLRRGKK